MAAALSCPPNFLISSAASPTSSRVLRQPFYYPMVHRLSISCAHCLPSPSPPLPADARASKSRACAGVRVVIKDAAADWPTAERVRGKNIAPDWRAPSAPSTRSSPSPSCEGVVGPQSQTAAEPRPVLARGMLRGACQTSRPGSTAQGRPACVNMPGCSSRGHACRPATPCKIPRARVPVRRRAIARPGRPKVAPSAHRCVHGRAPL